MRERRDFADEIANGLEPEFLVGHFTAAESKGDLHLHLFAKEIDGMGQFHSEIVRIDIRAQLDLLHAIGVLVLFVFFVFFRLLVTKLAVINQPAHRRGGVGRNFDEIDPFSPGHRNGFGKREDAELRVVFTDHPHLFGANFPVYPNKRTGEGSPWGKRAFQDTLFS